MADNRAIGIFDSGLGGLTVAREVISRLPQEDIVYFGDTGRVPYGTRSRNAIKKYAAEDEHFLLKHNVKLIIAACGTVSSVAAEEGKSLPVPFFEMITHAAGAAVEATKNKKIGVIGTPATVKSESHKREILKRMPDAQVTAASCSLFVPLVEAGWYDAEDIVVRETVRRYLEPIIAAQCDTLILGCTHYPVLETVIQQTMGDSVTLINPGIAVAAAVADYLTENGAASDKTESADHKFYVSDKPETFQIPAAVLLGEEMGDKKVEQVDLNSL